MNPDALATATRPDTEAPENGRACNWTVVVVARDEITRRGIEGLLFGIAEVGTVYPCARAEQLGDLLGRLAPEVVIVTASEGGWLDAHGESLSRGGSRVLMVVDHGSIDGLAQHVSAPVGWFLWQPELTSDSLREALRRPGRGEPQMAPELVRVLLERSAGGDRRPRQRRTILTDRERQALALLVRGFSNKQIARRLAISSHGAKRLVASIMLKLDAPNRTLAAVTAIQAGLLEPQ